LATLKEKILANYNVTLNTRGFGGTVTASQNVTVGDTVTLTYQYSYGYNGPSSVSGCTYVLNSNVGAGGNGTATYTLTITSTSSYSFSLTQTYGSRTGTISGSSQGGVTPPQQFYFTDVTTSDLSTYKYDYVQITGINSTNTVTGSNATYMSSYGFAISGSTTQPNTSGFTGGNKTITNNQYLHVRMQSSGSNSLTNSITLNVGGVSDTFSVTTSAQTIVAPAISYVQHNNAAAANVTAAINLSSSGSGGTLQYAQSTSNSVPSSGWQSSTSFAHPRGTTRYYWASRSQNSSGTYGSSASLPVGYLTADVSTGPSNVTIASNASSATVSLTTVTSGETYAVRAVNGSSNFATAVASSAGVNVGPFTSNIPSAGSVATYEIFALRPTSSGGDGSSYLDTNDQFTVTKQASSGGGSGGGSLTSFTYGAEVYNNSGQALWGTNIRSTNIGGQGTFSVSAGSYAHVTVQDMTTSNTDVLDVILVGPSAAYFWTSRGPGYYSIQNPYGPGGPTLTGKYLVVRYG
jgi:hypothetical protein